MTAEKVLEGKKSSWILYCILFAEKYDDEKAKSMALAAAAEYICVLDSIGNLPMIDLDDLRNSSEWSMRLPATLSSKCEMRKQIKYISLLEAAAEVLDRHAKTGDDELKSLANIIYAELESQNQSAPQ